MRKESSAFISKKQEKVQDFFFQSEQDGLFFGLDFLNHILSPKDHVEKPEITAYFQDGDCIFKNQTILRIQQLQTNVFEKKELLFVISYLSGVYTLVSCFIERQWDFSIIGSSSDDFLFFEWEEKAISKAGGLVQKTPQKMFFSQKEVLQAIEAGEKKIILNSLKINVVELKNILQKFPQTEFSLYGSFLPEDLEEFRYDNISSVYPLCLQGSFPCLKMKLI